MTQDSERKNERISYQVIRRTGRRSGWFLGDSVGGGLKVRRDGTEDAPPSAPKLPTYPLQALDGRPLWSWAERRPSAGGQAGSASPADPASQGDVAKLEITGRAAAAAAAAGRLGWPSPLALGPIGDSSIQKPASNLSRTRFQPRLFRPTLDWDPSSMNPIIHRSRRSSAVAFDSFSLTHLRSHTSTDPSAHASCLQRPPSPLPLKPSARTNSACFETFLVPSWRRQADLTRDTQGQRDSNGERTQRDQGVSS